MPRVKDIKQAFHERYVVNQTTGCWLWMRGKNSRGYGVFRAAGYDGYAHRLSFILHRGPIPDGLHVCHKCDTPACVNPAHLFTGTRKDNMSDMTAKGRHGSWTKPERRARGARAGVHTKPECRPYGERNGFSKLTPDLVHFIREKTAEGHTRTAVAKMVGVGQVTVSDVILGKTWSHLK